MNLSSSTLHALDHFDRFTSTAAVQTCRLVVESPIHAAWNRPSALAAKPAQPLASISFPVMGTSFNRTLGTQVLPPSHDTRSRAS
jgi:hypothetical protein